MFSIPTVLVLGAGASQEFGFPSGPRLLTEIWDECSQVIGSGDFIWTPFGRALAAAGFNNLEQIGQFENALLKSGCNSIDEFLEYREDLRVLGKAAIAACLIPKENPQKLFKPDKMHRPWYSLLTTELFRDTQTLSDNKLSVVTFNYDRSLEHFLIGAVQHKLKVSEADARSHLNSLPIVHVHGQLGRHLGWQGQGFTYDPETSPERMTECIGANGIRILHEKIDKEPVIQEMHKIFDKAMVVIFLGFGYHDVNLARLADCSALDPRKICFGTNVGLGRANESRIKQRWGLRFDPVERSILDLISEHGLSWDLRTYNRRFAEDAINW